MRSAEQEELRTPHSALRTPKITDFGIARLEAEPGTPVPGRQTRTGDILGTPSYMAPEQAGGVTRHIGPTTDVYALGAILYEMLTGRPPFLGENPMETLLQVLGEDPVPPRRLQPKLPRDLETICLKCLQKEPAKRYASAEALADDLQRFLAGEPIHARPVSAWEKGWAWVKRRPATAGFLAALLVAALALVGAGVGASYNAELRRSNARTETALTELQHSNARTEAALAERETFLYFNRIVLAEREWSANNVERAEELLADCPPARRGWEWHYLQRLCHADLHTFTGHTNEIWKVAYSPDGTLLASGGADETVKVWDVKAGRLVHDLRGHHGWVRGLAFSPDGRRLASCSGTLSLYATAQEPPGELKIWDVKEGKALRTVVGPGKGIIGVAFRPDGRWLAYLVKDGPVVVEDADTGEAIFSISDTQGADGSLIFSPDGHRLALGAATPDGRGEVRIFGAGGGGRPLTLSGHGGEVIGMAFRPDGRQLASASADETVKVWDADTGKELLTLRGHQHIARGVAYRPDGRRLASCSEDGTAKVWDAETGEELLTLRGHRGGGVNSVAFSPDGTRLATGGDDRTVRLWDPAVDPKAQALRGHTRQVRGVAFDPAGQRLASASDDGTVTVWDLASGRALFTLRGQARSVRTVAFSPDGHLLASGGGDGRPGIGELTLWDAATGHVVQDLAGHTGTVLILAFSGDGRYLASGSTDRTVKLWEVATGRLVHSLAEHTGPVAGLAFSPDGQVLVSASHDLTIKFWEVATGRCTRTLSGHTYFVYSVAFSPDGRHLALASGDATVKVLDAQTGELVQTLRRHIHNTVAVVYSPDGTRLASASEDLTVKLWDAATGQEIITLRGVAGWEDYNGLAFSSDGQRIAAPGKDGTVRVWDGRPLAVPGEAAVP